MAMFVRLADACGDPLPATQKAFFRNLVALAIAGTIFLRAHDRRLKAFGRMSARDWSDLVLRAVFGTVGIFLNFHAISHIPIGDAMALNKTAPFFTLALSWVLLGERMRLGQVACVAGAFGGAMLVVNPGFAGGFGVPAALGLVSGFCAGTAYALLHRLGRRGVNGGFIIFFFSVFSCLACVPFMAFDYHPMTVRQLLALCGAGAGAAVGQFGITWAYRYAEPRQIAAYDYTGILFTAALGFLVFGQVPDFLSVIGFLVITLMAVVVFSRRKG